MPHHFLGCSSFSLWVSALPTFKDARHTENAAMRAARIGPFRALAGSGNGRHSPFAFWWLLNHEVLVSGAQDNPWEQGAGQGPGPWEGLPQESVSCDEGPSSADSGLGREVPEESTQGHLAAKQCCPEPRSPHLCCVEGMGGPGPALPWPRRRESGPRGQMQASAGTSLPCRRLSRPPLLGVTADAFTPHTGPQPFSLALCPTTLPLPPDMPPAAGPEHSAPHGLLWLVTPSTEPRLLAGFSCCSLHPLWAQPGSQGGVPTPLRQAFPLPKPREPHWHLCPPPRAQTLTQPLCLRPSGRQDSALLSGTRPGADAALGEASVWARTPAAGGASYAGTCAFL